MSATHRRRARLQVEYLESRCVPSTFTVTNLLDDGSAGCLRSKIVAANNQPGTDTIVFKPGLEGSIHLTGGQIGIASNLSLIGPGAAKIAVDGSANDRIFNIVGGSSGPDLNVTIRGLELRNGKVSAGGAAIHSVENLTLVNTVVAGNEAGASGGISAGGNLTLRRTVVTGNLASTGIAGGIYFDGTSLTIDRSTISGNQAPGGKGGGLYLYQGDVTITRSVISGNMALKQGGGIYAAAGVTSLSINASTVRANRSADSSNGFGGGICTDALHTTINGSTISGNAAAAFGGGVEGQGPVMISRSTIAGNTARGAGGVDGRAPITISQSTIAGNSSQAGAGGIAMLVAPLTLTDSTVSDNIAGFGVSSGFGGGLYIYFGPDSTITGCTFSGNVGDSGGAIYLDQMTGACTIRNSTISGNRATTNGGGIKNQKSTLTVQNCTITFNRGGLDGASTGGGISSSDGTILLLSTIVALNGDAGGHPDLDSTTTPFTVRRSLIGDSTGASSFDAEPTSTGLLGKDPLLAPLAFNGGPTMTHALKKGSPCINNGAMPITALPFDQRGKPFKRQLGSAVDIGAFERQ